MASSPEQAPKEKEGKGGFKLSHLVPGVRSHQRRNSVDVEVTSGSSSPNAKGGFASSLRGKNEAPKAEKEVDPDAPRKWKLKADNLKNDKNEKITGSPSTGRDAMSLSSEAILGTNSPSASPVPLKSGMKNRDKIDSPMSARTPKEDKKDKGKDSPGARKGGISFGGEEKPKMQRGGSSSGLAISRSASADSNTVKPTISSLICAFEQNFLNNENNETKLTQRDWNELFKIQTVRSKGQKKEKASILSIFSKSEGKNEDDEDEQVVEVQEEEKINIKEIWGNLDFAKKKRRFQQFLSRRTDVQDLLTELLRNHVPCPSPDETPDVKRNHELILYPCEHHRLELGSPLTDFESQMRYLVLEEEDVGDPVYKNWFFGKDHYNWFGKDAKDNWVIVSIQGQGKGEDKERANSRVLIRSKQKAAETTFVPCASKPSEMLESLQSDNPTFAEFKFKKVKEPELQNSLLGLEKQLLSKRQKIGALYVKKDQRDENEIFANNWDDTMDEFKELMDTLAERITLQGHTAYTGGLDTKKNTTGTHSYYKLHRGTEIMFHVGPLLPYFPMDVQQVERKRHIGNDIVTVIFLEPGVTDFDPRLFISEFLHIFAFVSPVPELKAQTGKTHFKVSIAYRNGVQPAVPALPHPPIFQNSPQLQDFLLTKLVNSERRALRAPVFEQKMARTRKKLIEDLAQDYNVKL